MPAAALCGVGRPAYYTAPPAPPNGAARQRRGLGGVALAAVAFLLWCVLPGAGAGWDGAAPALYARCSSTRTTPSRASLPAAHPARAAVANSCRGAVSIARHRSGTHAVAQGELGPLSLLLQPKPRLVFMGTPDFAASILERILAAGEYEVVAVYCQPPREAGRGKRVLKSAVQAVAEAHGLPVLSPVTLRNATAQLAFAGLDADVAVVAAYGLLLPKAVLDAPRFGCVNVHGSLLPRWRGASPVQCAVLAGDAETGVTIMKMDEGMDTGPMLSVARIPIGPDTTSAALFREMTAVGSDLLLRTLPGYLNGSVPAVPQPAAGATKAPKIKKEEARLDWAADAAFLERKVRAFDPSPGTYFEFDGERFKVLQARAEHPEEVFPKPEQGRVVDDRLGIACGRGVFRPLVLQRAGRKAVPLADFLRGFPIPPGTKLDPAATAA
eukprot:EG_transcript_10813